MNGEENLLAYSVKPRILVLLCGATALAHGLPTPVKAALTIMFLLIVPGVVLLNRVPIRGSITRFTLALTLSLALASITAQIVMAFNGWFALGWPLETGFWVLLALSLLLSIQQAINDA